MKACGPQFAHCTDGLGKQSFERFEPSLRLPFFHQDNRGGTLIEARWIAAVTEPFSSNAGFILAG
jgi:hypothetical protein